MLATQAGNCFAADNRRACYANDQLFGWAQQAPGAK